MPLDMFQRDRDEAAGYALANSAPDLPVEAGEAFSTAFLRAALFGQSTAALNARTAAAAEYAGELEAATGDQSLRASLSSGGIDRLNARIRQIAGERPDLGLRELDDDELTKRQAAKSRQAVADYRAMADREKTLGGTIGFFAGGAVGDITDPVNLTTFPLAAPASLGIIGTAAAWSAIGGGTQLAIEALGAPYRERIQPGYVASGEPLANIVGTAAFAGVLGSGIKGAAAAWTRLRTGEWPRSVRDAGNVVDSEANIQGSNALPGVEGEVAHREALGKAIDDIAAGKPVDVSEQIAPELWQASRGAEETAPAPIVVPDRSAARAPFRDALADEVAAPADADDVLLRNLDRLRAERPDVKIPVGEAIDADGRATPVMRSVDDALAEADARLTASREIMDCVGGYPEAAQ